MLKGRMSLRAVFAAMSLFVLLSSVALPVVAQSKNGQRTPKQTPVKYAAPAPSQEDTLLIMPNAEAEQDDIDEAIKDLDGEIVGTYGEGPLKVLIVKTAKNKFIESERSLTKDKNFKSVSRNYYFKAQAITVNDPFFPQQWHLHAVNAVNAWGATTGTCKLGILDTGCNPNITDLKGHCLAGYNIITNKAGQIDDNGHGTAVATAAAATKNNGVNSAGVAPKATIVPIKMADANGNITSESLMRAIDYAGKNGVKIINISANIPPPYSLANSSIHTILHVYMRNFYEAKGGLIFNAAGNDGVYDQNSPVYYLNVVSGVDQQIQKASFSNYGPSVTFTGPAQGIICSNAFGQGVVANGTSFSCPIVAAIAATVWSTRPTLKNTDVNQILKQNCIKPEGQWAYYSVLGGYSGSISRYYGYGMPDAHKCVTGISAYLKQPKPTAYYVKPAK